MKPDFGNPLTRPRGEYSLKVEKVAGNHQVWAVWLLPSNEQLKSRGFAGTMPEDKDQRRSFQLFRKTLTGFEFSHLMKCFDSLSRYSGI